jgi:hypothetical protein
MEDEDNHSIDSWASGHSSTAIPNIQTGVFCEFPLADEFPGKQIPVKALEAAFDSVEVSRIEQLEGVGSDGGMRVFLRVRPPSEGSELTIKVTGPNSISTVAPDCSKRSVYTKIDERHYSFSRVFGADTSQTTVFEVVARPLLSRFLSGEGCVLLAYGMTNGGKTHTIQGRPQDEGVFPRLLRHALDERAGREVRISMLEIYQDKIFDLLSFRRENLHIRDNGGQVEVGKLSVHAVGSMTEALQLLDAAAVRRSKVPYRLRHTITNLGDLHIYIVKHES